MSPTATTYAEPNESYHHQWDPIKNSDPSSRSSTDLDNKSDNKPTMDTTTRRRKSSRLGALFHSQSHASALRSLDIHSTGHSPAPVPSLTSSTNSSPSLTEASDRQQQQQQQQHQQQSNDATSHSRRSSMHSFVSGTESPGAKLGRSLGSILRHFHHQHHHSTPPATSEASTPTANSSGGGLFGFSHSPSHHHQPNFDNVDRLESKYGPYIKPTERKKHLGGNKKNVASGATAVIRLVQPRDGSALLAVKEFIKKDKNEDERTYRKRMQNEYCISKSARGHSHVVETMDLVLDEHDRWCTVMEYVSCPSFFHRSIQHVY